MGNLGNLARKSGGFEEFRFPTERLSVILLNYLVSWEIEC